MSQQNGIPKKVTFKDTLNLPKTDFPIRSNPKIDDSAMIIRWEQEDLYTKSFYAHQKSGKKFVLHDGPPYANGHIHLGSSYNKILKDITAKSHRMIGFQVPLVPGWDCHGLPIEHKVTAEQPGLSSRDLKKACRAYATKWIDIQLSEFKGLAVLMNWNQPYKTMDYSYEAGILRVVSDLVAKGYIERKSKTVAWCYHCQTVLASAEIEYYQRKDPSIHVLFEFEKKSADQLLPTLEGKQLFAAVWTTTPWTLPLNRALSINPNETYVVLDLEGKAVVIGASCADKLCNLLGAEKKILAIIEAKDLAGGAYKLHHPTDEKRLIPIIANCSVETAEGTAFVHTSPGCGPIDYEIGVQNSLEIYSPITPDGRYTEQVEPKSWAGIRVDEAQGKMIGYLMDRGMLLHKGSINHSYPHCWRCRNGLIFRATSQWFCDLAKNNLKGEVIKEVDSISMYPTRSVNHLKATVESRPEWCISRQRTWGVPIPAVFCKGCQKEYLTVEMIDAVAQHVQKEGIECWDDLPLDQFFPKNVSCERCGGTEFTKEHDILDVWFEAGSSNVIVLKDNNELSFPADLYLEGRDQHRGWFQSSLLISTIVNGQSPTKAILTHGYTVDQQGRKMSKSLGNVVTPQEVIDRVGTDALRLWVSSVDCSGGDIVISDTILQNVQESFRKIRNTCRFLISNLYDFSYEKDTVEMHDLLLLDYKALQELYLLQESIIKSYTQFDTAAVYHALVDYCTTTLSATYLDIVKDRLYVEKANGKMRRSAQTVCYHILDTLVRLMAPILSITAEQLADLYQKDKVESIHLQTFAQIPEKREVFDEDLWKFVHEIRSVVLKHIESLRETGVIKHSLEARISLFFDGEKIELWNRLSTLLQNRGEVLEQFFKELFIVSQCIVMHVQDGLKETTIHGLYLLCEQARGVKCPRCWQWEETSNRDGLCSRCINLV